MPYFDLPEDPYLDYKSRMIDSAAEANGQLLFAQASESFRNGFYRHQESVACGELCDMAPGDFCWWCRFG